MNELLQYIQADGLKKLVQFDKLLTQLQDINWLQKKTKTKQFIAIHLAGF